MKTRTLPLVACTLALAMISSSAFAGPKCKGDQPKMDQAKVKQMYEQKGYEIKRFKVSSGGCYEIYGMQHGKKVEVYIDPWNAAELQKETR